MLFIRDLASRLTTQRLMDLSYYFKRDIDFVFRLGRTTQARLWSNDTELSVRSDALIPTPIQVGRHSSKSNAPSARLVSDIHYSN